MVECLLERGADPNIACNKGHTPLFSAAYGGCLENVKALLAYGADPSMEVNYMRRRAVDVARQYYYHAIVKLLQVQKIA